MPQLKSFFSPQAYRSFVERGVCGWLVRRNPSLRGAVYFPPGHFYSPLLDLGGQSKEKLRWDHDGPEFWEHVDMRSSAQRNYYELLLKSFPPLPFPQHQSAEYRYFWDNHYFPFSDAFTLSTIVQQEKPARIIEVGSGFSSAVMLDTLDRLPAAAPRPRLTFIEPYPERLQSLLTGRDRADSTLLVKPVQEVPLSTFDELKANDILFIDSSHVAKVGSDVTFLFLRVLPRLKPGVIVHVHDICYPHSYPMEWLQEGRAWNETLFLRALLIGNSAFEMLAFNCYAIQRFPELFRPVSPLFCHNAGGSLWLRKVA